LWAERSGGGLLSLPLNLDLLSIPEAAPAWASGTTSAPAMWRQCPAATFISLNAITKPAVREPTPFVTPS